jgi:Flp pilus assembly protein TadG
MAMKASRTKLRGNLVRGVCGSEIAEFAMILPLFFMIFMGVFWFGQAFRIYGTLTHGARAGAEAAVAAVCTTCPGGATPAANAQTAVYNALAAAHLDKNNLVAWGGASPKWTPPTFVSCTPQPVSCDNSITDVCVQTNVQLSAPAQGGMGTCGISVSARYQYAYSFRIPLTSLDLGNMLLPGQAQMRLESQ